MRKILIFLLMMSLMLTGFCLPAAALTDGQQNIVRRARQLTEIEWTARQDVTAWNGKNNYKAGQTYTGVPYGQPVGWGYIGYEISLKDFLSATETTDSRFYTRHDGNGTYYATDCSGFVSYAWGLTERRYTGTLSEVATRISGGVDALEVGDCLNLAGSHVVLVTALERNAHGQVVSVEISEQTPPLPKVTTYTLGGKPSLRELETVYFNKGYVILRYDDRYSVPYVHSCASPLLGDACASCGSTLTAPAAAFSAFTDVPAGEWYYDALKRAYELGLFKGTDTARLSPDAPITRAMFVTILGRLAGAVETTRGDSSFADVPETSFYAPFTEWAYRSGVTAGTGNGCFSPNVPITREEMAEMLLRYVNYKGLNLQKMVEKISFTDTQSEAVSALQCAGIINGVGAGEFAPGASATRAQAAAVLGRFLDVIS